MYRMNEDPWDLQDELAEANARYGELKAKYTSLDGELDVDALFEDGECEFLAIAIEDLKQRINFAWQDQGADSYDCW